MAANNFEQGLNIDAAKRGDTPPYEHKVSYVQKMEIRAEQTNYENNKKPKIYGPENDINNYSGDPLNTIIFLILWLVFIVFTFIVLNRGPLAIICGGLCIVFFIQFTIEASKFNKTRKY